MTEKEELVSLQEEPVVQYNVVSLKQFMHKQKRTHQVMFIYLHIHAHVCVYH